MDTCRPTPDGEAGDADLSLMSYLDCCESAYKEYAARVTGVDYRSSFNLLVFHTPFGGMVKGAHRTMMRKVAQARPAEIEEDFQRRVMPGLRHCQRVGNIMGGTVFMALASAIDHAECSSPQRVGCFSYGSGCCSEFFSGVITPTSQSKVRQQRIGRSLDDRHKLTMQEYDSILLGGSAVRFGTRNVSLDPTFVPGARRSGGNEKRLYLKEIREFHRGYEWA
jgi:polyketide biosynthesis 3-hydroxy-3-methylglutaryl-CoA synthase-like enzyme PksG